MMPGDNQSKTVAIAADATVGNCQNCSVLHQTVTEYVSSFLALKQEIAGSHDTVRLQQQVEELQVKLVTLEKKTCDYDSVKAELEEKKNAVRACEQMSEEIKKLKQENSRATADNENLEKQLKDMKEITEKQSLDNMQLKRDKAAVENELLETQVTLTKSRAEALRVEQLIDEKAKIIQTKEILKNQVSLLEDSVCKKNHQISQLVSEKGFCERNMHDLQVRLLKLERERNKEYRSISTQAKAPEEPKVDHEKVRTLLEELWTCVDIYGQHSKNQHLSNVDTSLNPNSSSNSSLLLPSLARNGVCAHLREDNMESHIYEVKKKTDYPQMKMSPPSQKAVKLQVSLQALNTRKKKANVASPKNTKSLSTDHRATDSSTDPEMSKVSVEEIMKMFRPLPPCMSPLPYEDTETEPMETEDEKTEIHPQPLNDLTDQQVPLTKTLSSSTCHNLSSPAVEKTTVTTLDVTHPSSENDPKELGQNEWTKTVETKQRTEGKDAPKDMFTEQGAASPSSSSPPSDNSHLVVSVTGEENPVTSLSSSKTESPLRRSENQSETPTKMDVDGRVGFTSDKSVSPEAGDSGVSVQAGDVLPNSPPTFPDPVANTKVPSTVNNSDVEKTQQDTFVDEFVPMPQQNGISPGKQSGEPQEGDICMSGRSTSNKTVKKINESKGSEVENSHEVQRSIKGQRSSPSLESHNTTGPQSPPTILQLNVNDDGGQESEQAAFRTTSDHNLKLEHKSALTISEETYSLDYKSLAENTHTACRRFSPVCLFPSVKVQSLEACVDEGKSQLTVGNTSIRTHKKLLRSVAHSEQNGVDDDPQENRSSLQTSSSSLTQHTVITNGLRQCLEPSTGESGGPQLTETAAASPTLSPQPVQCLGDLRSKMGPPLPPLLTPLSTPPKHGKSISPCQAIGKLSFPSPLDRAASPHTPVSAHVTSSKHPLNSLNSPLRSNGVLSSPLQFGSATPKHAVPVPGRLPVTAKNASPSSSSSPSQENSMRILDTMYPEMSARARTLSILRGNVNLSICTSDSGTLPTTADSQVSGFKSINSTSTAFTKTEGKGEKRPAASLLQPQNNKCRRLDDSSDTNSETQMASCSSSNAQETASSKTVFTPPEHPSSSMGSGEQEEKNPVTEALEKIQHKCFDLLPVVQSHVWVKNLPKKPVMREEEKDVVSDVGHGSRLAADDMMSAILNKLKAEKNSLSSDYTQALCRVYTALCRQRSLWEQARVFAYCILTEDFPDAAKLILFMATTWPSVFSQSSPLCQAIHIVTKLKANDELLTCLTAFLGWEKMPPCDIDHLISRLLSELRTGSGLVLTEHNRYGHDLGPHAWEHVFTLHLLCMHKKWKWTYEHVLGKELWPLMNSWMTQPRDRQTPVSDVTVATVLRLIGCLGQMGMKEKCVSSVVTVASVINAFGRHGLSEGVPWEVQLAAIYCIYELSPCNPKQAMEALAGWREDTSQRVPPAVTSCINQLASVCRQVKS